MNKNVLVNLEIGMNKFVECICCYGDYISIFLKNKVCVIFIVAYVKWEFII